MKIAVLDVHGAHGLTFKLRLRLQPESPTDKAVFKELQSLLNRRYLKTGKSALCSYEIVVNKDQIEIGLAEEMKLMAKVDFRWNAQREDQKFVVLEVQGDPNNREWPIDECRHFKCFWCHKETWGVQRTTAEVYSNEKKRMVMVNVHHDCQEKRDKQVALVPFTEST